MYRLLRARAQMRERRAQARRPAHIKPELVATAPNQVWSWDITKLAGPYKWNWFQLYVILDVYSRYAVAWLVAPRESAKLAEELIAEAIFDHGVGHGQLSLHADRGSSMTSKTVTQLLADLGVLQSHSRPHQDLRRTPRSPRERRLMKKPLDRITRITTTTSTGTRVSACTLRLMCTSVGPMPSGHAASRYSMRLTPRNQNGSGADRARPEFLRQHGSTDPRRRPWPPPRSEPTVSHRR